MKRTLKPPQNPSQPRQKFPDLEFLSQTDPFSSFFSTPSISIPKGTFKVDPYPEILLQDTPLLSPFTPHRKLPLTPTPFLSLLSNYTDVLITDSLTPNLMDDILHHVLTHIYKQKSLIEENDLKEEKIRDQGFTPANVLILVPTLGDAQDVIEFLIRVHCKGNRKRVSKMSRKKYEEVFHEDYDRKADAVKFGMVVGERELDLISSFKRADVVLATPLSLRQGLEKGESFDSGILASVQICVVLQCHVLLMQNWDHIQDIFKNMNLIPDRDSVTTDINRIRSEFLDSNSKPYLQLILQTSFQTPLITSLFNSNPKLRGKSRTIPHYPSPLLPSLQKFRKFPVSSTSEISQKRFSYFSSLWSKLQEDLPSKSLLFVSCYYEFVRIKSWLEENDPGVLCISEYTPKPDRQRSLSLWKNGSNKVICITERLVYYRPIKFTEVGTVVFYEIPEFKEHYLQVVEKCGESLAIFCKFDGFALQRVVGDAKAAKMLGSCSEIFSIN